MAKNEILENISIEKLIFGGKWLATHADGRKIMITGGGIPGSIVNLRVLKSKKNYIEAQILDVVKPSPLEQSLPSHYQVYGGCKWLPIPYAEQLAIKNEQVHDALRNLRPHLEEATFHPIVASPETIGYRNKVEFSWGKYISDKEGIHEEYRFGFHKQWEFDRIIDCTYCVLADEMVNAIFAKIDKYARMTDIPTYDPKRHDGFWRHLVVRRSKATGETMLVFSANTQCPEWTRDAEGDFIIFVRQVLVKEFPEIVSVYLLQNTGWADIVAGDPQLIFGKTTITERLMGLEFEIAPKSFFQTNSLGAEALYSVARSMIRTCGQDGKSGTLLDLYAGTGTIGIVLSKLFHHVYSVELVRDASEDAVRNAKRNGVVGFEAMCAKAEDFLTEFKSQWHRADAIVVDPPRDGMYPSAPLDVLAFGAKEIVYVSCNPATLARDLEIMVSTWEYRITDVTPVDMFPHTHHIETVVRLEKR